MQYTKTPEGKFVESSQKNIDTGMGVERTVAVLNGFGNVYECDTLKPILEKVKSLSSLKSFSHSHEKSARIITDHIRAAVMVLGDGRGIVPGNVDQGYVLRKFIRRAIRHARLLGIALQAKEQPIVANGFSLPNPSTHNSHPFLAVG